MAPTIFVVGSSNMDLLAYVPRFPAKGETLHGSKFVTGFGGKVPLSVLYHARRQSGSQSSSDGGETRSECGVTEQIPGHIFVG